MSTLDCGNPTSVPPEEPPKELLEELCAKFILTAPKDALSKDKLFFLVEQAWWYYEDKVRPASSLNLKHYSSYTTFAEPLFRKCEALVPLRPNLQSYLEDYRRYKQSIPVFGAILLDSAMEQVLLVRGNKSSMGWGFPRGKVNEGELEADCAIREVLEETGYDIRSKLREGDYLEVTADGKRHKLYLVTGLDPNTQEFEPHSKWEIGAYAWHRVDALPATAEEASQVYMSADGVRHRFFMIHPFVGRLRKWIEKRKRQLAANRSQQSQSQSAAYGGGSGGGGVTTTTNNNNGWSITSSTASSMLLPLRDLLLQQQQQQQAGQQPAPALSPAAPATPMCSSVMSSSAVTAAAAAAAAAVAGAGVVASSSTASLYNACAGGSSGGGAAGRQGQGRKGIGRSAAEGASSGVAVPPPQQQQGSSTVPTLLRQTSRKGAKSPGSQRPQQQQQQGRRVSQQGQGQVQQQRQERSSAGIASSVANMSNFRFDRDLILSCFAAVA
ncbi:hypothetical protein Agub_g5313 [Astrephomene gubernaculifera]|uniref:Nudix hydrolase domain-containing protein n=1 Tax=Astrephomene gubernaculifera TaxID=47775 RepID=A0AAD3DQP0_9CHLO|nr:hypothetical protein Agub_g5313 [Astrephomene gubernaculifera]